MRVLNLNRLLQRVRSAHLARVFGMYLLVSWATLEAIDLLTSRFGLPGWFFPAGLALLVVGLPVVMITAAIQSRLRNHHATTARAAGDAPAPAGASTDEAAPGQAVAGPAGTAAEAGAAGRDERPGIERLFTWKRAILGGALAFLVLISIGATVVWVRVTERDLRADAVAVMPFHVVGEGAELWREGLIDLLATALDATGQFHSSDPRAVLNRWRRVASDPDELPEPGPAAEVAASLGAGRVILGSLIRTGPDAVRLSADLYSVRWRRKEASAVVEGSEDGMTALVDRLTLDLLRSVWQGDELPEVRVSALTTASIPALRAYLEGEQAFRRSQFREAQQAFNRAIDHDSAFAIAHYRLGQTYGWFLGLGASQVGDRFAAAERHSQGLPPRDSLLIRGWKLADVDGDPDAIALFQELVNRYPDDLEAWHGLGDALFHMGAQVGSPLTRSVEPFERTLALDSTFAPSLIHLIEIAYATADTARGRAWTDQYLALDSTSLYAQSFRLLTPLHFGPPADSARAAAALDTVSHDVLNWALARMRGAGSPLPLFQRVALEGADPRFSDPERHMPLWWLGIRYIRHGQIDLALELMEQSAGLVAGAMDAPMLNVLGTLRELGLVTDSSSARLMERRVERYDGPRPALAVEAARDGHAAAADSAIVSLESLADSLAAKGDSVAARSLRGRALALRGRVAAVHDSVDAAISQLRQGLELINATWSEYRDLNRYWLANLIEDRGGEQEALTIYGSLYFTPWLQGLGYYHRARLHERRGELDAAARYYARFVDLWSDADPHLQPRVDLARQALDRLRGDRLTS